MKELDVIKPETVKNSVFYHDLYANTEGVLIAFDENDNVMGSVNINDEEFTFKPTLEDSVNCSTETLEELQEEYKIHHFKLFR